MNREEAAEAPPDKSRLLGEGRWLLLIPMGLMVVLGQLYPPFSDSAFYFYDARIVIRNPGVLADPRNTYAPPLLYLLGGGAWAVAGEIGLKLVVPLVASLGLAATYLLGRELLGHRTALLGSLFLGFFPLYLHQGSLGYLDGLVTSFSVLTLYAFYRAVHGGGTRWALLAGAAGGASALSKVTGPIALGFVGVYAVARTLLDRRLDLRLWKTTLLTLLVGGLLGGPYYLRNYLLWGNLLMGGNGAALHFVAEPYPNLEFFQVISPYYQSGAPFAAYAAHGYWEAWGVPSGDISLLGFLPPGLLSVYLLATLAATGVALYGLVRGALDHRRTRYLLLWLLLWVGAALALGPGGLIYSSRRILPVFPVLALLAALGYQDLEGRLSRASGDLRAAGPLFRRLLPVLLVALMAGLAAGEVAKAAYGYGYAADRQPLFNYIRTLPSDAVLLAADKDLVTYYTGYGAYQLTAWRLDKFDVPYFQRNGVGYVVDSDGYYLYDLAPYRRVLEERAAQGAIERVYQDAHNRVYRVPPLPGPPPVLNPYVPLKKWLPETQERLPGPSPVLNPFAGTP